MLRILYLSVAEKELTTGINLSFFLICWYTFQLEWWYTFELLFIK